VQSLCHHSDRKDGWIIAAEARKAAADCGRLRSGLRPATVSCGRLRMKQTGQAVSFDTR
jgi:hypothetical protein